MWEQLEMPAFKSINSTILQAQPPWALLDTFISKEKLNICMDHTCLMGMGRSLHAHMLGRIMPNLAAH